MKRLVAVVGVLAGLVVLGVLLWPVAPPAGGDDPPGAPRPGDPGPVPAATGGPRRPAATAPDGAAVAPGPAGAAVLATFGWGSGEGQLGRDRPQEGNPEAPMSLAADGRGNVWVLDQVNNRLVKLDRAGRALGTTPLPVQAGQDVAIAGDGTAAVLDRLADRSVALIGPDGQPRGELPIVGKGLAEGGAATGVFVDGDGVYVEREHTDLVRVGSTSGLPDPERPVLPGRPSRDGATFLTASIVDAARGMVMVTAVERASRAHRFSRQYGLSTRAFALVMLDSDRSGIIYLGALVGAPGSTDERPVFGLTVLCLDPLDGRPLGRVALPANLGADETFRELAVPDEGGILFLRRTEAGAQLQRYTCG